MLSYSTASLLENNCLLQMNAFLKFQAAKIWNSLRNFPCYFEASLETHQSPFSPNLLQSKSRDLSCSTFHLKDISVTICILNCNQTTFYTLLKIWQHTQETFVVYGHMPQHASGGQVIHVNISVTFDHRRGQQKCLTSMT